MKVDFYHLTLSPVDRVLPRIAEKVLQSGARLLIVAGDAARRDALDKMLWSYAPESFLPHMPAGGGDDTRQPILIAMDLLSGCLAYGTSIIRNDFDEQTRKGFLMTHGRRFISCQRAKNHYRSAGRQKTMNATTDPPRDPATR